MAEIRKEPIDSHYEVGEELGRGRFAVVKKCTSKKTGEVYAGKFVRKARQGRSAREQLLLEIDILHTSEHPKMVRLYDVFETRTEMVLVIEYAPGGDLHRHCLEQVETVRTEKEICHLIRQIVEAVRYLHENNVVHLDLKPENILLKTDSRFPEIRLIDFGLSRRLDVPYSQFDIVGTPEYVAPEVLSYEPLDVNADMWSIGVVTYVLLSGISPFAGDDVMETYANIGQVEYDFEAEEFDDISDEAKDFIDNLLVRQQKKRMSSREALEHPWLKQLEDGIKPEDYADAIKAESIIPTDVLTKAAELDPVQEETVSDAESEDYLSRESTSSPEEEGAPEEMNSEEKAPPQNETDTKEVVQELPLQEPSEVAPHAEVKDSTELNESSDNKIGIERKIELNIEEDDQKAVSNIQVKEVVSDDANSQSEIKAKDSSQEKNTADVKTSIAMEVSEVKNDETVDECKISLKTSVEPPKEDEKPPIVGKEISIADVIDDTPEEEKTSLPPKTLENEKTANRKTSPSLPLYDALLSGLSVKDEPKVTDENMNDNSLLGGIEETTVERKKSTAIDIDAILGISSTPTTTDNENKSVDSPVRKKTFNIDDIIGNSNDTGSDAVESETVTEKPAAEGATLVRQPSSDHQEQPKEKPSKVKAAASIFAKEGEQVGSRTKPNPVDVPGKTDSSKASWKSQGNRPMRHSFDMNDSKSRVLLEKSRSADAGEEETAKLANKYGSLPANVSHMKRAEPLSLKLNGSPKSSVENLTAGNKVSSSNTSLGSTGSLKSDDGKKPTSLRSGSKLQAQGHPSKLPSPCDDVKTVRQGIAAQMASKFSGKEANNVKDSKASQHAKDKDGSHAVKVSQRIQELSSAQRKGSASPPSSRSGSERSTPERTFPDRPTPERSSSERITSDRRLLDRRTPERSSSEKSSSGRSTPDRKAFERTVQSRSSSERSTPERGSPDRSSTERSGSPVGVDISTRRANSKSRESTPPLTVSDRVKRAEVMFKKEDSPPNTSSTKPALTIGKGTPMKFVIGETFKVDFSPGAGMQLGSKSGSSESEQSGTGGTVRTKTQEKEKEGKRKKDGVPPSLENINGAMENHEKKPRSKTDTEALKKAAEIIRNSSEENEGGRRRQPSMAELRGRNPSIKSEKGSPSSPRKSYRRLYVTHVKGSKALEVAEGPISDVAEVKQKVDEDGLQVQLVMKLPTF